MKIQFFQINEGCVVVIDFNDGKGALARLCESDSAAFSNIASILEDMSKSASTGKREKPRP